MDKLREWWELQDAKKQRLIKIVGGLAVIMLVLYMIPARERTAAPDKISPVDVNILGDDGGAGDMTQMASELKVLKGEFDKALRLVEQQGRRMQNLQNAVAASNNLRENPEQLGALVDEFNRMKEDLQDIREKGPMSGNGESGSAPVQLVLGGEDSATSKGNGTEGGSTLENPFSDLTDDDPGPIASYDPLAGLEGSISSSAKDGGSGGNTRLGFLKESNLERPPAKIQIDEPNEPVARAERTGGSRPGQTSRDLRGESIAGPAPSEIYIPSGSLFEGVLINGMDAPTSSQSATEPYPATIRVTSTAFLPNRFRTNVKECLILAAGFGRLDSERVHLRTEMMSCILRNGSVIDLPVEGYITGEDGKVGLRGTVVERTGQLLMRAGLAGLASGLSDALEPQRIQTVQTGSNAGGIVFEPPDTEDVLTVGAYAGAAKAMEKLADFYLKRADQIFPIIEIDAMRTVTIHLTKGVQLKALEGSHYGELAQNGG